MTLPLPPNTTCDLYRSGNAPPSAPDVANVALYLAGNYEAKLEHGESQPQYLRFTHIALMALTIDVRDGFNLFSVPVAPDHLFVPDQNGTEFVVTMVERRNRGQATEHLRVYLHRAGVNWPSDEL